MKQMETSLQSQSDTSTSFLCWLFTFPGDRVTVMAAGRGCYSAWSLLLLHSEPQLVSGSLSSLVYELGVLFLQSSCKTLIRFMAHVCPVPSMVLGTRKVLSEPYFPRHLGTGLLGSFEISLSDHLSNQPRPGAVK